MMNLSVHNEVHRRCANGKIPVSLPVLWKVRYQQPADNVYSVLQHAFIIFFLFPPFHILFHIPFGVPFYIPFHSAFQLLQFPDHNLCTSKTIRTDVIKNVRSMIIQ